MEIHEYQAKELLRKRGVPIPPFFVAFSEREIEALIEEHQLEKAVVKVQVHAGGRGKAGGVKIAKTKSEVMQCAKTMLGMRIVNNQTGPQGLVSSAVLIAPLTEIKKEYYVGCVIDRKTAQNWLIVSPEGGMSIEEIAKKTPEKIYKVAISKEAPLPQQELETLCAFLGWQEGIKVSGKKLLQSIVSTYFDYDALLLEINPLVETVEGTLSVLDTKLSVDDNALFRQKEIQALYDPSQITPQEREAKDFDLAYVGLEGNIGCMVNGAGLAMATMDLIRLKGGKPANFLDVGGSATKDKVVAGFKILFSDPHVEAILVNIFGGIMNCETIALALCEALLENKRKLPIVIRMEGTNVEQAKAIIHAAKLHCVVVDSLDKAATQIVSEVSHGNTHQ
jgi:succinyl-CoA synthetase beta subunit